MGETEVGGTELPPLVNEIVAAYLAVVDSSSQQAISLREGHVLQTRPRWGHGMMLWSLLSLLSPCAPERKPDEQTRRDREGPRCLST